HGIKVIGCFVLGLDGDTPSVFREVLDATRELELAHVQVTFLTPFPGTPLYDRLQGEGRMTHPRAWERCTLFDLSFTPLGMTADELQAGLSWLMEALYSDEETAARRARYEMQLGRSAFRRAEAPILTGGFND
ncbi:MAG TPA: DUF4070 domain-containing protein, partial [Longimicrobiales bacterium]|nr:DUF4070 domain-containing protein [Longimicrobiales bacterium]